MVVRFPGGPQVSLKTVDPPKGNGLGQKKNWQIDCGRRKGVWKCASPMEPVRNVWTISMLEVYHSVMECTALYRMMWLVWEDSLHSILRMVNFQRGWCDLVIATVLMERFAAEWCIYIWIWCKRWTFGLITQICPWHLMPSSLVVMTWYTTVEYGTLAGQQQFCFGDQGDWPLLPSLPMVFVFIYGGDCEHQTGAMGLHRLFRYLAFLHYMVCWWFQRHITHWLY